MAVTSPLHREEVVLADGAVYVRHLVETDGDVVRVVRDADDPVEAARQCLRIGARAVLAAHVSVETDLVEKRFDAMASRFDARVEEAVGQICEATEGLLGEEDGALAAALATHRQELDDLLDATFDPDSKRSVVAVLEHVLADAHDRQVSAVRRLVALEGDDSPLVQVKRAISQDLAERLADVRRDVQDLAERVAVKEAVSPVLELTTAKGFRFEDVVHERVGRLAAQHHDVADRCGTEPGQAGTNKGDEIVTLCHDDTHGIEACFVLEAKSRKLTMRRTLEELDDAMENRGASAAVAVFASLEQAPTSVPFHCVDDKAIVVLDPEGLDDTALRLAYMWARWVTRRSLAASAVDELDLERIGRLLDDARRALDRVSTVRRAHTTARRQIEQAGKEVDEMVRDVREVLDELDGQLAAVTEVE